ncbi:hypothetical protein AVEN_65238-1 [Araneus ventricosus]|uniref:Uncharacterized protein n=1 Tax=Araneus ventricosus TaxID=182803 RepID=A0A4Y2AHF6_ARAVE|nr:hypothetical protein AVEN_65238-1 [Araneus ventricosus]
MLRALFTLATPLMASEGWKSHIMPWFHLPSLHHWMMIRLRIEGKACIKLQCKCLMCEVALSIGSMNRQGASVRALGSVYPCYAIDGERGVEKSHYAQVPFALVTPLDADQATDTGESLF